MADNWASQNPGVIIVFCIAFLIVFGIVFFQVIPLFHLPHEKMGDRIGAKILGEAKEAT